MVMPVFEGAVRTRAESGSRYRRHARRRASRIRRRRGGVYPGRGLSRSGLISDGAYLGRERPMRAGRVAEPGATHGAAIPRMPAAAGHARSPARAGAPTATKITGAFNKRAGEGRSVQAVPPAGLSTPSSDERRRSAPPADRRGSFNVRRAVADVLCRKGGAASSASSSPAADRWASRTRGGWARG